MMVAYLKILRQSKILDPIRQFREVANYKINMQKFVVVFCMYQQNPGCNQLESSVDQKTMSTKRKIGKTFIIEKMQMASD